MKNKGANIDLGPLVPAHVLPGLVSIPLVASILDPSDGSINLPRSFSSP
jgi:hypothetical protein